MPGIGIGIRIGGWRAGSSDIIPLAPDLYPAIGDIIEISHDVTYSEGVFTIPEGVTAFFFVDNGLNMTAYYNGIVWVFFYVKYGKLYNYYAIDPARTGDDAFTSSDEYRNPSDDDWQTLINYCIASSEDITSDNIGNHLKSRRQDGSPLGSPWNTTNAPRWLANATHYGLDTFRFGLVPEGDRSSVGAFRNVNVRSDKYTTTASGANQLVRYFRYNYGTAPSTAAAKMYGRAIKLLRTASVEEQAEVDGTVVGVYIQNNGYPLKCVKIGTQVWTSEVFETKWRGGDLIPFEGANPGYFTDVEWAALVTPGVCDYNDNESNSFIPTYAPLFDKYSGNPILTKGVEGTWESVGIRDPILLVDSNGNMVQEGGKYIMYYNGRDPGIGAGNRTRVGRVTSNDFLTWTKEASNPVFEDGTYAGGGSVIKRGTGDYIMYYSYDAATKFNYATSIDGITWVANEVGVPILSNTDIPDCVTIGLPNVVEIDGIQYMAFEASVPTWKVYMAKSINWVDWTIVGQVYTSESGYFDSSERANPSLYKVDTNYYIIIYNGHVSGNFQLGMLHSNSIETGWKRLQDAPILYTGSEGSWDDTRIEGGRVYRDKFNTATMKMLYFGLPTTNSFLDGAIGMAIIKPGVTFEHQTV